MAQVAADDKARGGAHHVADAHGSNIGSEEPNVDHHIQHLNFRLSKLT